jgi:cytochrome d ubiquinol oxidase subunit I
MCRLGRDRVVAVESGWITAEVGRQPWIVWEYMKVADAVTNISAGPIWASFAVIVIVYALIAWAFLGLLLRMRLRWRRQDAQLAREEAGDRAEAGDHEEPARTEAAP